MSGKHCQMVWALAKARPDAIPSSTALLIMLRLADRSDPRGFCWTTQKRLAADVLLSRRALQTNLQALEDAGLVRRAATQRGDGGRGYDEYWLTLPAVHVAMEGVSESEESAPPCAADAQGPAHDVGAPGAADAPEENQPKEPKQGTSSALAREAARLADAIWQQVLDTGARKRAISKPKIAAKLLDRLKEGHASTDLMAAARAYWSDPEHIRRDGSSVHQAAFRFFQADGSWAQYMPAPAVADEDPDAFLFGGGDDAPLDTPPNAPPAWQQQVWAEEYAANPASWRPERGPRPGQPGCRVSQAILLEAGVQV